MDDATRGERLAYRMDRLGISGRELATMAKLNRSTVANARLGKGRGATFGKLEAVLDRLEVETSVDVPDPDTVSTVRLPDGTVVTFTGPPSGVAEAVQAFLRQRNSSDEAG